MCKNFIPHLSATQHQASNSSDQTAWRSHISLLSAKLVIIALAIVGLFSLLPHHVQAQANCESIACVTSGPRLASVDTQQSALLNSLLGNLLGANLNLSVLDSNALAQAQIGEDAFLKALQTELGVATPEDVLTATVTLAQVIHAIAQVSNDAATISALNTLAATPNLPIATIHLGDLLKLDTASGALSNVNLNVLDLLTGSIELFNSQNVLTTPTPITISGNALGLGGLVNSVTLQAQVIEPPVYVCGKAGAQFYSAGIRLRLAVDLIDTNLVTTDLKTALQGILGGLIGIDVDATIGQFDLYVDVARGAGIINQINAVNNAVTIQATPGVADLYLGTIQDAVFFSRTHIISPTTDLDFAQLGTIGITLTTLGVPVSTSASLEVKSFANGDNPTPKTLNFVAPYPNTQTASTSATFVTDLVTDLVTNLQVRLTGSLGGVLDPLINTTILPNLHTILGNAINNNTLPINPILANVVDPLLADLGIGLGEMDVTVNGVAQVCDTDGDGIPDALDSDDDGDGILDIHEGNGTVDTDHDGKPDSLDLDSDNDGVPDSVEGHDANHDGQADHTPSGHDVDHDGLDDAFDPDQGGVLAPLPDTDGDGKPDFQDADDDGDGTNTVNEDPNSNGNPRDDDTDGDGRPDYLDPANTNPCIPNAGALACTTGDTDGDGVPNGTDPAPTNPCVPNANSAACQNDTDGDGTPNGTDPAPNNPCVPNANAVACATGDADGDGTPNGSDPAPLNPCVPNANAAACTTGDTDNDGTPNGSDPAPTNPCVPNANAVACTTGDTDHDGTPNGTDPAPTNPCVPNANAAACQNDTDGDGTPNGTDPAPNNPCVPNANAVACTTGDADGDGTPNGTDPEPLNPCVPNANALACTTGDADGDGTPSGADSAPTNPCIPNANAVACGTGDADGDGTLNGGDPAPADPCIPNPSSQACQASNSTPRKIYFPWITFQQQFNEQD